MKTKSPKTKMAGKELTNRFTRLTDLADRASEGKNRMLHEQSQSKLQKEER